MDKAKATKNPLRKLYYWTIHWAETKFALPALFTVSFAEASFFPIPPDVLLMPMCFAQPKKWVRYAFWCTMGTVLGAVGGWLIGTYLWSVLSPYFFKYVPGFTPEQFEKVSQLFREYGFWIIIIKGLTPIPFKVITICAGACKVPLWTLIVASFLSRAARFYMVAGLIRAFGERVRPFLEKHLDFILFVGFLMLLLGVASVKLVEYVR